MTNKYSQLSFHDLSLRFYYEVNNLNLKIIFGPSTAMEQACGGDETPSSSGKMSY